MRREEKGGGSRLTKIGLNFIIRVEGTGKTRFSTELEE